MRQRQSVNTDDGVFTEILSLVGTGPLSDLNLQPVCWLVYNTCSYARMRDIRLWNSTSSTGPLTICHFLTHFPPRLVFFCCYFLTPRLHSVRRSSNRGLVYLLSGFLQYNYGHFDKLLAKLTYIHICKYQYPHFNGLVGGSSLF